MASGDRPRLVLGITLGTVGGAQLYVMSLLEALRDEYDVVVAAHGDGPLREAAAAAGVRFVPLRWMRRDVSWREPLALLELVVLFRRLRPVIVHVTSSKMGAIGRVAAWLARVPVRVFTVQGWAFTPFTGAARAGALLVERALRRCTTVLVIASGATRDLGVDAGACRPEDVVVLPNAVELGARPAPRAPHDGPVRIVSVVRLQPQKDVPTLVRALARLEPSSFEALIVGDGPDRAAVEAEIRALRLEDRVQITGWRSDVRELLEGADLFALSSAWEEMPFAILEAMAAGLPVVSTDVGGVAEAVADGETGLLVAPGDPDVLAEALRRAIADPALRARLGAAGRARAEEQFGVEAFRRRHLELYAALAS